MDPQVSASFIPKKPLADTRGGGGGVYSILFLVSLLIFITSVLSAGGAFMYTRFLNLSLNEKKASLEKSKQAYDLPTIQALVRFDSRINESRRILEKHLTPSAIFTFLSQQTLVKVRFTDFDYTISSTEGSVNIQMTGVADSFSTIALQSDQFGSSKSLRDVVFSNISVGEGSNVSFSVSAKVDPALIFYRNNLQAPIDQLAPATL